MKRVALALSMAAALVGLLHSTTTGGLAQILKGDRIEIPATPSSLRCDLSEPGAYIEGDPDTGISRTCEGDELAIVVGQDAGAVISKTFRFNQHGFQKPSVTFSQLRNSAPDGAEVYCSDCAQVTPCAGSGSGADAARVNGQWECSSGGTIQRWIDDPLASTDIAAADPNGNLATNGANVRIYASGGFTDASNASYSFFGGSGFLGTQSTGTGPAPKSVEVFCDQQVASGSCIGFWIGGVRQWFFDRTDAELVAAGGNGFRNIGTAEVTRLSGTTGSSLTDLQLEARTSPSDRWVFEVEGADAGTISANGFAPKVFTQATLPAGAANGTMAFCSNCNQDATCTSGGGGAFAFRLSGAWVCELN